MNKRYFCGLIVICVAIASLVIAEVGFPIRMKAAGDDPEIDDAAKFGTCENKTPQPMTKCFPEVGNCLEYSDGETFVIGTCYTFHLPPINWHEIPLPNGTNANSAKAIESRGWGKCNAGGTSDTCQKCGKYFCCKAKFWLADACPVDETPVVYAVARENVCDPS